MLLSVQNVHIYSVSTRNIRIMFWILENGFLLLKKGKGEEKGEEKEEAEEKEEEEEEEEQV